jgi:subtilase family serine protease
MAGEGFMLHMINVMRQNRAALTSKRRNKRRNITSNIKKKLISVEMTIEQKKSLESKIKLIKKEQTRVLITSVIIAAIVLTIVVYFALSYLNS